MIRRWDVEFEIVRWASAYTSCCGERRAHACVSALARGRVCGIAWNIWTAYVLSVFPFWFGQVWPGFLFICVLSVLELVSLPCVFALRLFCVTLPLP